MKVRKGKGLPKIESGEKKWLRKREMESESQKAGGGQCRVKSDGE